MNSIAHYRMTTQHVSSWGDRRKNWAGWYWTQLLEVQIWTENHYTITKKIYWYAEKTTGLNRGGALLVRAGNWFNTSSMADRRSWSTRRGQLWTWTIWLLRSWWIWWPCLVFRGIFIRSRRQASRSNNGDTTVGVSESWSCNGETTVGVSESRSYNGGIAVGLSENECWCTREYFCSS